MLCFPFRFNININVIIVVYLGCDNEPFRNLEKIDVAFEPDRLHLDSSFVVIGSPQHASLQADALSFEDVSQIEK
jgi:hypothetical protein